MVKDEEPKIIVGEKNFPNHIKRGRVWAQYFPATETIYLLSPEEMFERTLKHEMAHFNRRKSFTGRIHCALAKKPRLASGILMVCSFLVFLNLFLYNSKRFWWVSLFTFLLAVFLTLCSFYDEWKCYQEELN